MSEKKTYQVSQWKGVGFIGSWIPYTLVLEKHKLYLTPSEGSEAGISMHCLSFDVVAKGKRKLKFNFENTKFLIRGSDRDQRDEILKEM